MDAMSPLMPANPGTKNCARKSRGHIVPWSPFGRNDSLKLEPRRRNNLLNTGSAYFVEGLQPDIRNFPMFLSGNAQYLEEVSGQERDQHQTRSSCTRKTKLNCNCEGEQQEVIGHVRRKKQAVVAECNEPLIKPEDNF